MKWKLWFRRIGLFLLVVIAIHLTWFGWRFIRYNRFISGFDTFIAQLSYIHKTEDRYHFNVKFPDYPTLSGNLGVTSPDGRHALVIWPKIFYGYRYGVQVQVNKLIYQIELDEDLKPIDPQFDQIFREHLAPLRDLFIRATEIWPLEDHLIEKLSE